MKLTKDKKICLGNAQYKEIIRTFTRQIEFGQRMRCEIAAAFLHEPKIVFWDEAYQLG